MSPVGLTKDAGWQIGVSRVVRHPVEEVWDLLMSAEGLACWLGPGAELPSTVGEAYAAHDGTTGELRSLRPHDRVRLTHQPPGQEHATTVQVALTPPASGPTGTTIRFHQERLTSAEERERQRAHWQGVVEDLIRLLDA